METKFTPEKISTLNRGEIFVFGSNLEGKHAGGAAYAALKKFGAIWGQGVGLQGQSYAIPTMQGGVDTIKPYTDQFIEFAKSHPEMSFLVTRIGCGIAGFSDSEIAPLFENAYCLDNVTLPRSFCQIIEENIAKKAHVFGVAQLNRILRGEDPFPEKKVTATADSFQRNPMPAENTVVEMEVAYREKDFRTIEMGHISDCMEDKWNMYCDGEYIRWYRSWTGNCIFEASYRKENGVVYVETLRFNQQPGQCNISKEEAIETFKTLMTNEIGYSL